MASSFGSQKSFDASEIKVRHSMFPTAKADLKPFSVTFGEGGYPKFHLMEDCDLIFQIGTAKSGVRTDCFVIQSQPLNTPIPVMSKQHIISWVAQLVVVIILGQTLFFKFTDSQETIELFSQLGMGAVGYKLIGFLELIACVLLLIRPSIAYGALLSWGLMSGAIMAHVTKVGFSGDYGILGAMAIAAWILSVLIIYLRRDQVSFIGNMFGDVT